MKILLLILCLQIIPAFSYEGCGGKQPNDHPVLNLEPILKKEIQNGKLWELKQDDYYLDILKVSGSPYEMGYAIGKLKGKEISQNLKGMMDYESLNLLTKFSQMGYYPPDLIPYLQPIAKIILGALLDLNFLATLPFQPSRYIEEMRGISAGSDGQVDLNLLIQINYFPEITKAACTIVGAWGQATEDGEVYHLRTLDWDGNAPMSKYPAIVIYDSNEEGSDIFANIGYLGMVGTLTAMSKQNGISMGMKVLNDTANPQAYPVKLETTYFGEPWMWVLRDAVQFSKDIDEVFYHLNSSHRTAQIHVGFGSKKDHKFNGFDYAYNFLGSYDDKNYTHYSDAHPQMDGIFFYDHYPQPSSNPCVGNILKSSYGKINAKTLYSEVTGWHPTGNVQIAVMKPEKGHLWVAYNNGKINAFERSMIFVDLNLFWN